MGYDIIGVESRIAQGRMVGVAAQRLYPKGRLIGHVTVLTTESLYSHDGMRRRLAVRDEAP